MPSTTALPVFDDPITRREMLAIAGFLPGFGTATRTGYATDLRQFTAGCRDRGLGKSRAALPVLVREGHVCSQ